MRIEGTLSKWIDDRSFGFITPSDGGPEIFVHRSTFPRDGRRPMIGERLTFEIATSSTGKKRAIKLFCPDRSSVRTPRQSTYRRRTRAPGVLRRVITRVTSLFFFVALAVYAYGEYSRREAPQVVVPTQPQQRAVSPSFNCDGRRYCSQMTSCEEAKFFVQNCGGGEMDGDNDGVPCEREVCSGFFPE